MFRILAMVLALLVFSGCTYKNDPFRIGTKPLPPVKDFESPQPVKLSSLSTPYLSKGMMRPRLQSSNGANSAKFPDIFDKTSDSMMIMAANSVVITVWAIAPRNWLWAYSPNNSAGLGNYRVWRFVFLPNNEVLIINANTRTTCMNTYGSGVIHDTCDENKASQRFVIRPMTNGAVQIYNKERNVCLQTPLDNVFGFDYFGEVALTGCKDTLDQQWYLLPPPAEASIVF
ncbi:MAG: hypothetical protein ACTTIC_02780 [Helicobacteraceae bacterium]